MRDGSTSRATIGAARRRRLTALLGLLTACALLASSASEAFASNYEIRGEWSIEMVATQHGIPIAGPGVIDKMEANGEYSGSASLLGGMLPAAISGTVSGNETSIKVVASTPATVTFIATGMSIDIAENEFSGMGTFYNEKNEAYETGTVKAKRLKTYQEVLEREAREQKEREEKHARENIRGEWNLSIKVGAQTVTGEALVTEEANGKNEFASSSALYESLAPGTFSGTLAGESATIKLTNQAAGPIPASEFTSSTIKLNSSSNPASMTGTGELTIPAASIHTTAEFTATKTHTFAEVKAREAKEREAREAKEREAREAAEREAKQAEEASAKQAREAKERAEREAAAKQAPPGGSGPTGGDVQLLSVELSSRALVASPGGTTLALENPNPSAVEGRLTLLTARGAGKARKTLALGTASFAIGAHGKQVVKLKLSKSWQTLARHKAFRVTLTIVTNMGSATSVSKKLVLTLRPPGHHGKG